MNLLADLIAELESILQNENRERAALAAPRIRRGEVVLLGQFSLIVNDKISSTIPLTITNDIDAWVKGDFAFHAAFKAVVLKQGYRFDDMSAEIWMPESTTFEALYES